MTLAINGVPLDDPTAPYVIAEAASSHCQDYATAQALVRAAADAGANAVKFQLFAAETLCADVPLPWGYNSEHDAWLQRLGVRTMRDLFRKGSLPREWCMPLKNLAESVGIAWLCTPFSVEEAQFLVEEVGVQALKIASGDLTYEPLLAYAASTELPIILSTGMAQIEEIDAALRTIEPHEYCPRVALLHCLSVYPCPEEAMNLRVIPYMQEAYACGAVGLSDHTLSADVVPALAVSLGASVYEKHMRLEGDTSSVDADHSLSPAQFRHMVEVMRRVSRILGAGKKAPHPLEYHDKLWARRDPSDWLRPMKRAREGAWA